MTVALWFGVMVAGTAAIVWGAEMFADNLAGASQQVGVSSFGLALLLAGAEPEELATVITASSRGVDGVAFGDVIGANAAIATIALGIGAMVATVPFGPRVRRYGLAGLISAVLSGFVLWDGSVSRLEGSILVVGYFVFVAVAWRAERRPPPLGETAELDEEIEDEGPISRSVLLVVAGLVVLSVGSIVLVEGVRRISGLEETQTRLGLVVVGFATAFELVVLAWSAGRRGLSEAVVAGVVGSYAYNLTMSLGAGAVVAPIAIADAATIRGPFLAMAGAMALALVLGRRRGVLGSAAGKVLLAAYPVFIAVCLLA